MKKRGAIKNTIERIGYITGSRLVFQEVCGFTVNDNTIFDKSYNPYNIESVFKSPKNKVFAGLEWALRICALTKFYTIDDRLTYGNRLFYEGEYEAFRDFLLSFYNISAFVLDSLNLAFLTSSAEYEAALKSFLREYSNEL